MLLPLIIVVLATAAFLLFRHKAAFIASVDKIIGGASARNTDTKVD